MVEKLQLKHPDRLDLSSEETVKKGIESLAQKRKKRSTAAAEGSAGSGGRGRRSVFPDSCLACMTALAQTEENHRREMVGKVKELVKADFCQKKVELKVPPTDFRQTGTKSYMGASEKSA